MLLTVSYKRSELLDKMFDYFAEIIMQYYKRKNQKISLPIIMIKLSTYYVITVVPSKELFLNTDLRSPNQKVPIIVLKNFCIY